MLIDTHCHLPNDINKFDEYIKNAKENMVEKIIFGGSDKESNEILIDVCKKYKNCYLTLGYHPSEVESIKDEDLKILEDQIKKYNPVAIGEIGLDYYYGKENKDEQIRLFKQQLDIATKYHLPIVVHVREAHNGALNILKEYKLKGVIHCYSGSLEQAYQYIKLGYKLGIGGVVTFKNSKLSNIVENINLEDILLETDSPYLSPIRGECNEPKNIKIIGQYVANLKNITLDDLAIITSNNAAKLFDLSDKN